MRFGCVWGRQTFAIRLRVQYLVCAENGTGNYQSVTYSWRLYMQMPFSIPFYNSPSHAELVERKRPFRAFTFFVIIIIYWKKQVTNVHA